jgi:hypothetical protein
MTITEFANKYKLHLKTDKQDDTLIIPGRMGHIYEYSPSELGVMILPPGDHRPRLYTAIKKKCLSSGMILRQDCDAEGALSFDPENKRQARTAIKAAQVRPKKKISKAHKAKLLCGLQTSKNFASGAILEGGFTC